MGCSFLLDDHLHLTMHAAGPLSEVATTLAAQATLVDGNNLVQLLSGKRQKPMDPDMQSRLAAAAALASDSTMSRALHLDPPVWDDVAFVPAVTEATALASMLPAGSNPTTPSGQGAVPLPAATSGAGPSQGSTTRRRPSLPGIPSRLHTPRRGSTGQESARSAMTRHSEVQWDDESAPSSPSLRLNRPPASRVRHAVPAAVAASAPSLPLAQRQRPSTAGPAPSAGPRVSAGGPSTLLRGVANEEMQAEIRELNEKIASFKRKFDEERVRY